MGANLGGAVAEWCKALFEREKIQKDPRFAPPPGLGKLKKFVSQHIFLLSIRDLILKKIGAQLKNFQCKVEEKFF